jgi:hypothetical protein
MKVLLEGLLPRLIPATEFLCVPHEGKTDLQKSIPRKLARWREPGVRFVVVHDNDGGDCKALKRKLRKLCQSRTAGEYLIRIACQELEAWYLGDLAAMGRAFDDLSLPKRRQKAQYRDPDALQDPSAEVARLVPSFQKISGARRMAPCLDLDSSTSRSFSVFIEGVRRLAAEIG